MLGGIVQGLFEWLYGIFLDLISVVCSALLSVMTTDLTFFEQSVPVFGVMKDIFIASGWAMLLGNFVFQATKSMLSGLGFESESPGILFVRTGIYGFLLVFSRQIFNVGLNLAGNIITLLQVPTAVNVTLPSGAFFAISNGWALMIIIGVILGIQFVKLFFQIGERYVLVCLLTLMAPLGFAMGGSRTTQEITKGYIRMYASMLVMMILNVVFLKMLLSAMSIMPSGLTILPWSILVVAIVKVARKADNIVNRIGLNAASTGEPLRTGASMMLMLAARSAVSRVGAGGGSRMGFGRSAGTTRTPSGARNPGRPPGGGKSTYTRTQTSGGSATYAGNQENYSSQSQQGGHHSSAQNTHQSGGQNAAGMPSGTPHGADAAGTQTTRFGGTTITSRDGQSVRSNAFSRNRQTVGGSGPSHQAGNQPPSGRFGAQGAVHPHGRNAPVHAGQPRAGAHQAPVKSGIPVGSVKTTPGANPQSASAGKNGAKSGQSQTVKRPETRRTDGAAQNKPLQKAAAATPKTTPAKAGHIGKPPQSMPGAVKTTPAAKPDAARQRR